MSTSQKDPYRITARAKIQWSGTGVSMAAMIVVLGYIQYYCSNMLGVSTAVVGTIMLISKVVDAVTDLVIGFLIDRTKTRFGKARPYEFAIFGVWLCTVLLYSCPDLGMTGKIIWIFAAYTFVNSIFATMIYGSEPVHLARAVRYEDDRNKLVSFQGVAIMLFSIIVSVTFPLLMGKLGTSRGGWRTLILIYAVPLCLLGFLRFFVKENNPDAVESREKVTIKQFFNALKCNPYIFFLAGMLLLANLVSSGITNVQTFYFAEIVGDTSRMSVVSAMAVVMVPVIIFIPALIKKFGYAGTIRLCALIGVAGNALRFFAGTNLILLAVTTAFTLVGTISMSYLPAVMNIQCMDYSEWKLGGERVEAAFGSLTSFCKKLGDGAASFFVGSLLGAAGYISTIEGVTVTQPASALSMIRLLYSFIPAGIMLLQFLLSYGYRLEAKLPMIRQELAKRHAENQQDQ